MVNLLYGLLHVFHASYGLIFLTVHGDPQFGALMNGFIYGIQTILWLGTFGNSKSYNTFWVYFDIAVFPIAGLMTMIFQSLISGGFYYD